MAFTLKKLLSSLLLPLPICLLLLIAGLIILAWTHWRKTGITLSCTGILVLLVFSINPVATTLLTSLENQYQPINIMPVGVKYIVVLGGGNGGSRRYPPNTRLSSASLARLIEAIRLHQQNPESILVLSGGRVFGSATNATVVNNTALVLGIANNQMLIKAGSKDTVAEAEHLKSLLKGQPFLLVTSAYHMPRAIKIFTMEGMHPIAAPTQFLIKPRLQNPRYYLPTVKWLTYSDISLHEYLGMLWLSWTHQKPQH